MAKFFDRDVPFRWKAAGWVLDEMSAVVQNHGEFVSAIRELQACGRFLSATAQSDGFEYDGKKIIDSVWALARHVADACPTSFHDLPSAPQVTCHVYLVVPGEYVGGSGMGRS